MAKFPTIEEMARNIAEKALDEYEYKGKTLRQWIEIILATDTNVATKDGTNLASLGTDCISRQQVIEALGELATFTEDWSCHTWMYTDDVYNAIKELPPIQPKRGRWIGKYPVTSVCSECGFLIHDSKVKVFAFCPNCGADMRGEQNG